MHEEMKDPPEERPHTPAAWRKAIPQSRDRLQSRILVWIATPVLLYLVVECIRWLYPFARFWASTGRYENYLLQTIPISLIFALTAWRIRSATPMAAICGGMICFLISSFNLTGATTAASVFHSGLAPLVLLFILTFEATRLGREKKSTAGLAESRKGRNAAQVVANLGVAGIFGSLWGQYMLIYWADFHGSWNGDDWRQYFALMYLPMLAALVEATADTVSSEIGQAFGGTPFLLPTFRRVPPGTDGAISLYGTLAGIASAALVAAVAIPAMNMSFRASALAFAAGVAGLFFDSLLGATLERKGWLGNDLVNFASTAFAAALALLGLRLLPSLYP